MIHLWEGDRSPLSVLSTKILHVHLRLFSKDSLGAFLSLWPGSLPQSPALLQSPSLVFPREGEGGRTAKNNRKPALCPTNKSSIEAA
jgi:hypothetical protein